MKTVCIKVAGSEREPIDANLMPGTTAGEILEEHNLAGYWLSMGNSGRYFGDDENIYKAVEDGDVLFAASPAKVACG